MKQKVDTIANTRSMALVRKTALLRKTKHLKNNEPGPKEHSDFKLKYDMEKDGKRKNTLNINQVQNQINTHKVNDHEIKVDNIIIVKMLLTLTRNNLNKPARTTVDDSESRLYLKESPRVPTNSRLTKPQTTGTT